MEHVLYIRRIKDLKFFNNKIFTRIYFGTEFCDKLIPSISEIRKILSFVNTNNLKLSIITPYVNNNGLEKIKKILCHLPKKTEIIFNDWGVLKSIQKNKLNAVMGRLLVSVKRDPRIKLTKNINYFKNSNINNSSFQEFVIKNNIMRIELDNVFQGYNLNLNKKINTSLYYPFVYITTSRKCMESYLTNGDTHTCSFSCTENNFIGKIGSNDKKIILKGNSQFYINTNKPPKIEDYNIDRFVYMPRLPF